MNPTIANSVVIFNVLYGNPLFFSSYHPTISLLLNNQVLGMQTRKRYGRMIVLIRLRVVEIGRIFLD